MQAARGASLSSSDPGSPPVLRRRAWWLFAAIAVVAYAVDLTTKELALAHLEGRADVSLVGDFLTLRLAFNPGAAFSFGTDFTWVFTCLSIAAAITVLVVSRRLGSKVWALGLGLLLAGVTGNLTDRIFRAPEPFHGHVVDMIRLPNWPIFNIADMCINVAAAIIVVQAFRGFRVDGRKVEDEKPGDDTGATGHDTTDTTDPADTADDTDTGSSDRSSGGTPGQASGGTA